MKRLISLILCGILLISLAACSGNTTQDNNNDLAATSTESTENSKTEAVPDNTQDNDANSTDDSGVIPSTDVKILVAYFSLADEQYEVGVIEKGNTQIVAEIIAAETGADLFSIESMQSYPTTYEGLLEKSRKEENNPPQIAKTVENMDDYDVVFIGYPIWWGDLPTIVRVFIESYDFSSKTVIPFCTHAGSGLSGTQRTIESLCNGATVKDGFAVRGSTAQNNYDEAESGVKDWLDGLGIGYD